MWHNITSKSTVNKPSSQEKKKNVKKLKQNKTSHLKKKTSHNTKMQFW